LEVAQLVLNAVYRPYHYLLDAWLVFFQKKRGREREVSRAEGEGASE